MTTEEENIEICEKLLGWARCKTAGPDSWWHIKGPCCHSDRDRNLAPAFTDWHGAGLILDALQTSEHIAAGRLCTDLAHILVDGQLNPLAIRSAALAYIRSAT